MILLSFPATGDDVARLPPVIGALSATRSVTLADASLLDAMAPTAAVRLALCKAFQNGDARTEGFLTSWRLPSVPASLNLRHWYRLWSRLVLGEWLERELGLTFYA